jgi:hypothetical protein
VLTEFQEVVPIKIFSAVVGAMLFLADAAMAADYRADEFLGLDLSKAVLSPKPLGPAAEFVPIPIQAKAEVAKAKSDEARTDVAKTDLPKTDLPKTDLAKSEETAEAPRMRAEPKVGPKTGSSVVQHRGPPVAHARSEKPLGAARIRLARRHRNPLDAQAFDTRIQAWPCKSGGICDWKQ